MGGAHVFRNLPAIRPGKGEVFMADPQLIKVDPDYNCRDMNAADVIAQVAWLADEIQARGFNPEMPLTVKRRGQDLFVVRGHCRLAGCMKMIGRGGELKTIPVMQLASGMSDIDLIFDQESSNYGLRLDEFAKGRLCLKARRLGLDDGEIARRMHWKNASDVQRHIKMVEIVPEPVKQQVAKGDISATEAVKLVKSLPAGTDPVEAAKIITANKEENKRLGVGKKTQHKVTAKTLQRDRPAPPKPTAPSTLPAAGLPVEAAKSLNQLQDQIAALTESPPPTSKIDTLLLGFIAADARALAFQFAELCRERDKTIAECGDAMQGQDDLCTAADVIGALRFPEDWDSTKATACLSQVAA